MKIELRDLKQKKWFIEIDPSSTIGDLKALNSSEQGIDDNMNQRFIFSGKILKDTDKLESLNYVEGKGYIVCMVSKKPAPKKTAPESSATVAAPKDKQPSSTASSTEVNSEKSKATTDAQPSSSNSNEAKPSIDGPSAFAVGEQLETAIRNITEMGYTHSQAVRAMRRAFNNPDRAVEYLVTGEIPEDAGDDQEDDEIISGASVADNDESAMERDEIPDTVDMSVADSSVVENNGNGPVTSRSQGFQELLGITSEEMAELKRAAIKSPDSLITMLHPLIVNNPYLANFILNHIDEFLADVDAADDSQLMESDTEETDVPGAQGGAMAIEITEEEDAAIKRLMELGFARHVVATAYLACDKDEMLTANYLLEHGNDP